MITFKHYSQSFSSFFFALIAGFHPKNGNELMSKNNHIKYLFDITNLLITA